MLRVLLSAAILILAGCSTAPPLAIEQDGDILRIRTADGAVAEISGDTLRYRGEMTEDGLDALKRLAKGTKVTTLFVDSAGGEIVVGMDFGFWVLDLELDVVVDRACLSSCANYVFPAGRHKTIMPGAVVAWHGSARQPGLLDELHAAVEKNARVKRLPPVQEAEKIERDRMANIEYMTNAIRKQEAFFDRIGVDEYITRIGNEEYRVRGFYYLSVEDMARFGITNVTAPAKYPRMNERELARRAGFWITYLKLR